MGWGQEAEASGQAIVSQLRGAMALPVRLGISCCTWSCVRACVTSVVRKGWETGEASGSVSACPLLAELAGVCLFCCVRSVPAQWSVPPPRPGLSGRPWKGSVPGGRPALLAETRL